MGPDKCNIGTAFSSGNEWVHYDHFGCCRGFEMLAHVFHVSSHAALVFWLTMLLKMKLNCHLRYAQIHTFVQYLFLVYVPICATVLLGWSWNLAIQKYRCHTWPSHVPDLVTWITELLHKWRLSRQDQLSPAQNTETCHDITVIYTQQSRTQHHIYLTFTVKI